MSQALYRKYRPKNFDEVYGQDNIVNILKNQIENNKISHAYIFSGTRGTGKTSCAKIFSRAVNCLNPINGNPCNECVNCRAVLEESTMDVIEMDAASNRRIDDIRQLRDNVIYPPTDLKYKVYIIDEAHMITNEGFNALLKIMEEPPKHLIFILATTEVEKIPDTILSRTQRFEFKKIDNHDIETRIVDILSKEKIEMDQLAINSISNIGKGSMRDALSVLDQVISIDSDKFSLEEINDILGILGEKTKLSILGSVIKQDVDVLIKTVDDELEKGKDSHNFIKEMIGFVELLLDLKVGINKDQANLSKNVIDLAKSLGLESIVNALDILVEYELRIKKSDNRNLLLKMAMIRLIDNTPRDNLNSKVEALEERISKIESGSIIYKKETKDSIKSKSEPISISEGNPFEAILEKESEIEKDTVIEKDIVIENDFEAVESDEGANNPFDDRSNQESELGAKEEQPEDRGSEEVPEEESTEDDIPEEEESEREVSEQMPVQRAPSENVKEYLDKRAKSIEGAIRNYALKKFPSSKQLFEQMVEYKLRDDYLIYYVNEKGYTISKVMTPLFRQTEEAYKRQTKTNIVIKFELIPTKVKEEVKDESKEKLESMKNFFGEDLEIL